MWVTERMYVCLLWEYAHMCVLCMCMNDYMCLHVRMCACVCICVNMSVYVIELGGAWWVQEGTTKPEVSMVAEMPAGP